MASANKSSIHGKSSRKNLIHIPWILQ